MDGLRRVRRTGAEEAPRHLASAFGGGSLPRQLQRHCTALRELELLRLNGLLGLQGKKLIRRLLGLQGPGGRLALSDQIGQYTLVFGQALRHQHTITDSYDTVGVPAHPGETSFVDRLRKISGTCDRRRAIRQRSV